MSTTTTSIPSSFPSPSPTPTPVTPPITNYILGFLLIGLAWGFTTPFIRRAARQHKPLSHSTLDRLHSLTESTGGFKGGYNGYNAAIKEKVIGAIFGLMDILRDWRYAVPLVINLTGSVWFFLLIGQAGMFFSCSSFSLLLLP